MTHWVQQALPPPPREHATSSAVFSGQIPPYDALPALSIVDYRPSANNRCLYQPHLSLLCAHPECDQKADCASIQAGLRQSVDPLRELSSLNPAISPSQCWPQPWSAGRALCIGINYFNQKGAMRGRTDEARSMSEYLQQVKHYAAGSVILLTDDQTGLFGQPTKRNILHALRWLGERAFQSENIIIYYSGHGRIPVFGHEKSSQWQTTQCESGTMYPVDFRYSAGGIIKSAEFDELLIPMKRKGAKLTIILDTQIGIIHSNIEPSAPA